METDRNERRQYAILTRRALLYGALAVVALIICAVNLLAIIGVFWKPSLVLATPVFMMFAAVSLWASVNFIQTRSSLLFYRDHPEYLEDKSVDLES